MENDDNKTSNTLSEKMLILKNNILKISFREVFLKHGDYTRLYKKEMPVDASIRTMTILQVSS